MKEHFRGNAMELQNGQWIYSDTKELVSKTWKQRPCGICGKPFTPEGHDPCLGTLPNVINACCGHGEVEEAYLVFKDGKRISGLKALKL